MVKHLHPRPTDISDGSSAVHAAWKPANRKDSTIETTPQETDARKISQTENNNVQQRSKPKYTIKKTPNDKSVSTVPLPRPPHSHLDSTFGSCSFLNHHPTQRQSEIILYVDNNLPIISFCPKHLLLTSLSWKRNMTAFDNVTYERVHGRTTWNVLLLARSVTVLS